MNLDLTPESLRRVSQRAAELYTEIYSELETRCVAPNVTREQIHELFADSIHEEGIGLDAALEEFAEHILPHSMGTPHPLYFGLVNSSPLPAGPLADLLVSSLNNNAGSFHQSPAISTLENEVVSEFAKLCGYGSDATGMIVPGGTFANLQGLTIARDYHFPTWCTDGPQSLSGCPRLYGSDQMHFCNERAAQVIGIGQRGIVTIPALGRGELDVGVLETRIQQDKQSGFLPFAVVASGGTTGTGAIDNLDAVADVCQRHDLWLHVDACYGGGALLLEPQPKNFAGLNRADSIAVDPHKWFFIPMTAGLFLSKHSDLPKATFDVAAPYIPEDGSVDAFRRGLPTSRRSSGLTVWLTLRAHGWRTIREAVKRNVALVRRLEELAQEKGFRVLPGGELSVACIRHEPNGFDDAQLNALQKAIANRVASSGQAWFSNVTHEGLLWMRMNLVNIYTREHHVQTLVDLVSEKAAECEAELRRG